MQDYFATPAMRGRLISGGLLACWLAGLVGDGLLGLAVGGGLGFQLLALIGFQLGLPVGGDLLPCSLAQTAGVNGDVDLSAHASSVFRLILYVCVCPADSVMFGSSVNTQNGYVAPST